MLRNKKMSRVKALTLTMLLSFNAMAANLIHPLDFQGDEAAKAKVISQIQSSVKQTYNKIGMGDPSTLRMMEKEELRAFKSLTQVGNRKLLDAVINQYCGIGMCNYSTILMMYTEQNRASKEKLDW